MVEVGLNVLGQRRGVDRFGVGDEFFLVYLSGLFSDLLFNGRLIFYLVVERLLEFDLLMCGRLFEFYLLVGRFFMRYLLDILLFSDYFLENRLLLYLCLYLLDLRFMVYYILREKWSLNRSNILANRLYMNNFRFWDILLLEYRSGQFNISDKVDPSWGVISTFGFSLLLVETEGWSFYCRVDMLLLGRGFWTAHF